jgi:hypothetical protein
MITTTRATLETCGNEIIKEAYRKSFNDTNLEVTESVEKNPYWRERNTSSEEDDSQWARSNSQRSIY